MENATKAILIAGGILITMLTVSLFYFIFNIAGDMYGVSQEDSTQKELIAFNTGFEAYNKNVMYGMDIISVLNQAIDNNRRYGIEYYNEPSDPKNIDYYVDIEFEYKYDNGITRTLSLKNNYTKDDNTIKNIITSPKDIDFSFKTAGYRCKNVYYNETGTASTSSKGRLNKMVFVRL